MKQSMTGSEIIKIHFLNYSEILDKANNPLTEESFSTTNPYPFVFLSESEA